MAFQIFRIFKKTKIRNKENFLGPETFSKFPENITNIKDSYYSWYIYMHCCGPIIKKIMLYCKLCSRIKGQVLTLFHLPTRVFNRWRPEAAFWKDLDLALQMLQKRSAKSQWAQNASTQREHSVKSRSDIFWSLKRNVLMSAGILWFCL